MDPFESVKNMTNKLKEQTSPLAKAQEAMKPPAAESLVRQVRSPFLADYTYEILKKNVQAFEAALDDNQEVAVKLAAFGQSVQMTVETIEYANPNVFIFCGLVGESRATLVQHVSQLNFLLLAVPRRNPSARIGKIGFCRSDGSTSED